MMSTAGTNEKLAKLDRLKHYATRYELAMTKADGSGGPESYLICYTPRKNRAGIWDGVVSKAPDSGRLSKIIAKTGSAQIVFGKRSTDGGTMGDWLINFTGRTQRQAICEGEKPYIGRE